MDIDAAGGAATAGLVGAAIETPAGAAGAATARCTDCGETVSGRFCSNCGQPTHVHRSLMHLGEEMLHGVLHFDARIWRTLPLLAINPGRLTREWVEGKRTRYVSPLALFLFTVFLMFFIMSFSGGGVISTPPLEDRIDTARVSVTELQASVAEAEVRVGEGAPGSEGVLAGLRTGLASAETRLAELEVARTASPRADGLSHGSWQAEIADAARDGNVKIGFGDAKLQNKILEKLANPDFALYKIQQTLYKFSFLLVPLSIPFVWTLFAWKRGFTWYDHGVFVLYSLTVIAMITMWMGILARWSNWFTDTVALLLCLSIPVHMFAQLKGTYSLRWLSALWRTGVLLLFCFFAIGLFLVAVILLGLTG